MANYIKYSEATPPLPPGVTYENDPVNGPRFVAHWLEVSEDGERPRRLAFSVVNWGEDLALLRAKQLAEKQRKTTPPRFYKGAALPVGSKLIEGDGERSTKLRVRCKGHAKRYDVDLIGIDEAVRRGNIFLDKILSS